MSAKEALILPVTQAYEDQFFLNLGRLHSSNSAAKFREWTKITSCTGFPPFGSDGCILTFLNTKLHRIQRQGTGDSKGVRRPRPPGPRGGAPEKAAPSSALVLPRTSRSFLPGSGLEPGVGPVGIVPPGGRPPRRARPRAPRSTPDAGHPLACPPLLPSGHPRLCVQLHGAEETRADGVFKT